MKFCTHCNAQLTDDTFICPNCGNELPLPHFQEKTINSLNNNSQDFAEQLLSQKTKTNKKNKVYLFPIIIGIAFLLIGLFIQVPGGALTTYSFLNGDKATNYEFDDKYTTIDEYVGGDAYNYIIGASLVAGKISGTMTTKSIFIVGGALCLCLGITSMLLTKKEEN